MIRVFCRVSNRWCGPTGARLRWLGGVGGDNGLVPTYRDRAVVLRTHKLGEADRIVTLLTRYNGKVRAVARGVRRTASKFGGRLEPFSHVDVQFVRGHSLDIIAQAETVAGYSKPLRQDYPRFTAGEVMLETADRLVAEEGEPALQQYHLLVGALHALGQGTSDGPRPPTMILDSYLLRSLAVAGYAPSLAVCARCGGQCLQQWFSVAAGGLVCSSCRPSGATRLETPTWLLLGALLAGDWPATRQANLAARTQAHELVDAFVTWHLEHALRSLPLLDDGEPTSGGLFRLDGLPDDESNRAGARQLVALGA